MNISSIQRFLEEDSRVKINNVNQGVNEGSINATVTGPAIDINEQYELTIEASRDGLRFYVQGVEGFQETKNSKNQINEFLNGLIENGLKHEDNTGMFRDDSHKMFINGIEQKIDSFNRKNTKTPLPAPSPTLMDACANTSSLSPKK
ncbi:hypothetical protein [Vibrio sp. D431a]|uniref:hypothetical protein n=1 Tax=Vibrio sp. D431a TaxID=2837388 RepID=UPI002552F490|nr:hypothetical protein [Vibrio sp. D431a]MDK9793806.1 hypothetical protein [Vibrio sp. D431a]